MATYPPSYHMESDEPRLFDAIDTIRIATLLVHSGTNNLVSFVPFLLDRDRRVLVGHVANRNPQATLIDGASVDAIFHGPHVYVSPVLAYNKEVPTWNYINVHVQGKGRAVVNSEAKWQSILSLISTMEGDNTRPYLDTYESRLRSMLSVITCFEIDIDRLDGRFKLGRNDPSWLQKKVFRALEKETPPSLKQWVATLAPVSE